MAAVTTSIYGVIMGDFHSAVVGELILRVLIRYEI
jgi:hypothetical protein